MTVTTAMRVMMRWMQHLVGTLFHRALQTWVRRTGRKVALSDAPWLAGYWAAGELVGAQILDEVVERHDLVADWTKTGGLLPSFEDLNGECFRADNVATAVHHFYEQTARHTLGVSAKWSSPLAPFAALLIGTACRRIDQCNLPLTRAEAAGGMTNDVVHLNDRRTGEPDSVCWLRRSKVTGDVIYAGLYKVATVPGHPGPCVKVVFPLPDGYLCVLLKPTVHPDGGLELISDGKGFGDVGFYWVQRDGVSDLRVKYVHLKESIRVFTAPNGELCTDHGFWMWGMRFLHLRYEISRATQPAGVFTNLPAPKKVALGDKAHAIA